MKTISAKPVIITNRWEMSALAYVYATIGAITALYIYITYRGSRLIGSHSNINPNTFFFIHLLYIVLETCLWVIISRSAVRLKSYALSVIKSEDGRAINYIADALILSLIYAVIFSMASSVKTLFIHSLSLNTATTISNLAPLAIALPLSVVLLYGSFKLDHITSMRLSRKRSLVLAASIIVFLLAIISYAMYFYKAAPRLLDDDGLHHFALMPGQLLVFYVLPYVAVWLLGMFACLNLAYYAHNVRGYIYRLMFHDLYKGLLLSLLGTYFIQIYTVSGLKGNRLSVGMVVYIALLGVIIKGFLLVYRGTNQLYRLEQ